MHEQPLGVSSTSEQRSPEERVRAYLARQSDERLEHFANSVVKADVTRLDPLLSEFLQKLLPTSLEHSPASHQAALQLFADALSAELTHRAIGPSRFDAGTRYRIDTSGL